MKAKDNNKELVIVTKNVSLTAYDPDSTRRSLASVRTVSNALAVSRQFPSLAVLRNEHGQEKIESIIKLYLIALTEMVNLKRELKENHIDIIAQSVVDDYYNLTIADVHVIFNRAKNGEYGTFYESLDVPKVMKWFKDYFEERCNEAALNSQYNNRVDDKGGNFTAQHATKFLNEMEKKLKKG